MVSEYTREDANGFVEALGVCGANAEWGREKIWLDKWLKLALLSTLDRYFGC
jgi:hypothetical protein